MPSTAPITRLEDKASNQTSDTLQYDWLLRAGRLSGMAMLVVDSNFKIQHYDEKIAELLEIDLPSTDEDLDLLSIATKLAQRGDFGPGDPQIFVDLLKSEFAKPNSIQNQNRRLLNFLTPAGRWVQFSLDQEVNGLQILGCKDITRKYVEKHALKVAMNSSKSGYAIYDIETKQFQQQGLGNIKTDVENTLEQIFSDGLKDSIHRDDYKKLRRRWYDAHQKKESWTGSFRTKNDKGETIWIKTRATPQVSESGIITNYIFFYTEITSQLAIQEDLRHAIERSEKSLNAKNAFLGRLSHDIRTPMNAIVGISDAIINHNNNPEIQPMLELIQTSVEKIIHIVDESLEHTKLAESKIQLSPQNASPSQAVKSVCALWKQKAILNGIDLNYRIDDGVPNSMIFDSHRYEQCLNNLISNAVKFSPAGRIQVYLTTIQKAGKNNLITIVKDTGIGMNEAQLENLFEAYTQADGSISSRFGGTGLGMNITKQIIELMDGKITAKSQLGTGTAIALSLPIKTEKPEEKPIEKQAINKLVDELTEENASGPSDYNELKVLIVDDNSTNHMVMKSLLGTMVKEIGVAENGAEAIQVLEEAERNGSKFDVVLMDIHMPVMDGIEATLLIRGSQDSFANIPIIALTADPQYQQRRLCKNIGMDDALAKPIKLTELLEALDRVIAAQNQSQLAA